jgi:FAD:protein FMN transferase
MKLSRRHAVFGIVAAGGGALLPQKSYATATRPATAFGTTVRLTVTAVDQQTAERAIDAGFAEIRAIEQAFNLFDEKSEISKLNRNGYLSEPSAMMLELVLKSDALFNLTWGAFDPSVQPLWKIWKDAASYGLEPSEFDMRFAAGAIGWKNVTISGNAIRFQNPNSAITLNGIAQGYAADRVLAVLKSYGCFSAVIDTGEFGISKDVAPVLTIAHPRKPDSILGELNIASGFVATSGDYATSFTPDYSHNHIFDPSTRSSPRELAAVTVHATSGARADGLATAFMVMGRDRSLQLAATLKDVNVLVVTKDGEISLSPGMKMIFTQTV